MKRMSQRSGDICFEGMMSIRRRWIPRYPMQLIPKAQGDTSKTLRLKVHPWTYQQLQGAAEEAGITIEEAADQLLAQALKLLRLHKRREDRKGQE